MPGLAERIKSRLFPLSIEERLAKAQTAVGLLSLLGDSGIVISRENYVGKPPIDALSLEQINLIIDRTAGLINEGRALLGLVDFMDQRLSVKIILDKADFMGQLIRNRPWEEYFNESYGFGGTILPIYEEILKRVDNPKGVPFLLEMLNSTFAFPAEIVQRNQRIEKERRGEVVQKGWDWSEIEYFDYWVTFEDYTAEGRYHLSEVAKAGLLWMRENNLLPEEKKRGVDLAIDRFGLRVKETYRYKRFLSEQRIEE